VFVLLVYDIGVDRVQKVLKTARKYLMHIQNSVLEGELTPAQYARLKFELEHLIEPQEDHIRFYVTRTRDNLEIENIGEPKRDTGNFL
jgi:CRISPR-associated protein Cas2